MTMALASMRGDRSRKYRSGSDPRYKPDRRRAVPIPTFPGDRVQPANARRACNGNKDLVGVDARPTQRQTFDQYVVDGHAGGIGPVRDRRQGKGAVRVAVARSPLARSADAIAPGRRMFTASRNPSYRFAPRSIRR